MWSGAESNSHPRAEHFSPHALRRRRGSLHYKRTGSLAEVAELLGSSLSVAEAGWMGTAAAERLLAHEPVSAAADSNEEPPVALASESKHALHGGAGDALAEQ